jgi:hypothetical protein
MVVRSLSWTYYSAIRVQLQPEVGALLLNYGGELLIPKERYHFHKDSCEHVLQPAAWQGWQEEGRTVLHS